MTYTVASRNFELAKFAAILIVVSSHFFGGLLWVPTVVALFVFGFSSGYFTGLKYRVNFSYTRFWRAKFVRLIPRLFVINSFLLLLFVFKGESGVWHWHTIVNMLGLSGFLNWFGIINMSPFGMGLWFFTVLLIFYVLFPVFNVLYENRLIAKVITLSIVVIFSFLHTKIEFGYQLWSTSISFFLGLYWGKHNFEIPCRAIALALILLSFLILVLNFSLSYTEANYFLLLFFSTGICLFLVHFRFPGVDRLQMKVISQSVLEIYFIHTYLFLNINGARSLGSFAASLVLIILVSVFLREISLRLWAVAK